MNFIYPGRITIRLVSIRVVSGTWFTSSV